MSTLDLRPLMPDQLRPRPLAALIMGQALQELIVRVPRWPEPGGQADVPISAPVHSTGGCAANVACIMSRLGGQAALCAKVGAGLYGQATWTELERSGVERAYVRRAPGPGSLLIILTVPTGDWTVLAHIDPTLTLTPADLPEQSAFEQAQIFHVDTFMLLNPDQHPVIDEALQRARAAGCRVALDAAVPVARAQPECLRALFAQADLAFCNLSEAAAITGETSLTGAVKAFRNLGPQLTFIKTGAHGSVVVTADGAWDVPAQPVEVVDTIAAGDAYVAATLLALSRGSDPVSAAARGSAAGALACQGAGSLTRWISAAEVDQWAARGPRPTPRAPLSGADHGPHA
jgi:sugar/nucleoside kinase (ribokinase family)